jgi:multiple antibiotic resistance protein
MATERYLQAFVTVLSLVNPAVCGVMFGATQAGRSAAQRRAAATRAAIAILLILSLTALFGARILKTFGISLDAFSVAGGLVLMQMGFGMLRGASSRPEPGGTTTASGSLTPLVLFAASPGTMTGVITLAVAHSGSSIPLTTLTAVAGAVVVTWLVMVLLSRGSPGRPSLGRSTVQAVMGLVVIAMGVQFGLSALRSFFVAEP